MVYIFMFVVYKQRPSNEKLSFSGIVFYTHLVFFHAHAQWEHIALSACSVIYNITPLLSASFVKARKLLRLRWVYRKKNTPIACQQYSHTAYSICLKVLYSYKRGGGGRERRSSNRYDFVKFAYNRPCFYTQRATLVLQIAKNRHCALDETGMQKIPITLGRP